MHEHTRFKNLCSPKASESPALSNLESLIPSYRLASFKDDDFVFDYDITTEEIKGIIKMLRKGKPCGPHRILPEHIIYGGEFLIL